MGKKDTNAKPAAPVKRAAKPVAKAVPVAVKKTAVPKKPAKKSAGFTTDDVALRAYFIAEKRRHLGQPGSEHGDWLEAERQLLAESKAPKKSAR